MEKKIVKRYRIKWLEGYGKNNGKIKVMVESAFNDDEGFDDDHIQEIKSLGVNESVILGGYRDRVKVTRINSLVFN